MLIREVPATELVVATRILAMAGAIPTNGRLAARVGSDVVYVGGRGASPHTLTPFDVAAVRADDAMVLAGDPPEDVGRLLAALRAGPTVRAAADTADGGIVTAPSVRALVETLLSRPWEALSAEALAAGALIGAFAPGDEGGLE